MKTRMPPATAPELRVTKKVHWRTYEGELVTPLIGGGVDTSQADKELPVRAASIRGHLRFWWRLLNADQYNGSRALFQAERNLWGGMAQGDVGHPSRVRLRVRIQGRPEIENVNVNDNPYVLFPFREVDNARWVKQGLRFVLDIQCDDEYWPQVEAALRWWATFDGLGMRTRRGMGKVNISSLDVVTAEEVAEHACPLVVQQGANPGNAWWAARRAVSALKDYRQGVGVGRNPGNQPNRPGRSRWPEADAIRAITGQHANNHPVEHPLVSQQDERPFPRAFFGMPIIYEIRGRYEPPKHSLQPWNHERMASPLFLFPYPVTGGYKPAALCLPVTGLENMDLNLKQIEGRQQNRRQYAGAWWPQDTQTGAEWAAQIRPMQGRGSNPLDAFLKFFGDQR